MSVSENILVVLTVNTAVITHADHGTPHFSAKLRINDKEAVPVQICLDSLHVFAHRIMLVILDGFNLLIESFYSNI